MQYKVNIIIEKDSHGYYAYCPELKGCQSQGETLEETKTHIQEAIELYLETLSSEDAIEDYCLNKAIDEGKNSPLLNKIEALTYLEK